MTVLYFRLCILNEKKNRINFFYTNQYFYVPIFSYYEYLINLNICEYFVFLNYLQQLHFFAIETILKLAYRNLFYELSILHGINIRGIVLFCDGSFARLPECFSRNGVVRLLEIPLQIRMYVFCVLIRKHLARPSAANRNCYKRTSELIINISSGVF